MALCPVHEFWKTVLVLCADRSDVLSSRVIEKQQEAMALALQGYTEAVRQSRNRFARIMSFLPMLRTLNSLCTDAFAQVHVSGFALLNFAAGGGLEARGEFLRLLRVVGCHDLWLIIILLFSKIN